MRHLIASLGLPLITGVFLAPAAADAQTLLLDEGTFVLRSGGREIGRESFVIRQTGTGSAAVVVAQGRVNLNDATGLQTSLETAGPALRPAAYQISIEGDAPRTIAGRVAGGRFSARIVSPAGEMMREYLAGDGAVIIDDGVAHQHYFLGRRIDEAPFRVPIIIPRQSRQITASISAPVADRVNVAGRQVDAQRFTVAIGEGAPRRVWVDDDGRVLRLEVPGQGLVAERLALPD